MIAVMGYYVVYSITQDMRTLAHAIDPRMEYHMGVMTKSVSEPSINVGKMKKSIEAMSKNTGLMRQDFAKTTNYMASMTMDTRVMNLEICTLTPMVKSINDMNRVLLHIEKSLNWIQQDMRQMSINFDKPMNAINSMMPFW